MDDLIGYLERHLKPHHVKNEIEYQLTDISFYITNKTMLELIIISEDKNTLRYYNSLLIGIKQMLENIASSYIDIIYGNMDWFSSANPCGFEDYYEMHFVKYNSLILR